MMKIYKDIAPIHFITHESEDISFEEQIALAIENKLPWVQLRAKSISKKELLELAQKITPICKQNKLKLIINDHVDIASTVDADGVHLGKEDASPKEARKILGSKKIIGGTANTFDDVLNLYYQGVDYIGLGPFRFTTTKHKLSPVLEFEGYKKIIQKMKEEKISIPLIAIGGIVLEDILKLKAIGVQGVAISSLILSSENREETIQKILKITQSPQRVTLLLNK